ncbi:hypothetical protein KC19_4G220700 [Ceratodon purpureus]|uniref:Uncharacterized protein n=1 Tax=Ceratodon purpureus TaxID=3225 RepID=A0A8T0ICC8_CERPU|nr:hypothetical protein KC19_4G220700 [Ceratodon purpureus]
MPATIILLISLYDLAPLSSTSELCESGAVSVGDERGRSLKRCWENFWEFRSF